jgi:hypothetical protein
MEMFIQSLLSHYTTPIFLVSAAWFFIFGFIMNTFVILSLTNLSMKSVMIMTYRAHAINVGIAALVGPLVASFFSFLLAFVSPVFAGYFSCNYATFLGLALSFYLLSSYFFCITFATVACNVIEKGLFLANLLNGAIGFFVLKAWGLL